MKNKKVKGLFELPESEWKKEWKNMPEFISEDRKPVQQIIVSFKTYEDVKKFGELLGLSVSKRTVSTWFPVQKRSVNEVYYLSNKWKKNEE
jgi:hypothetical protein